MRSDYVYALAIPAFLAGWASVVWWSKHRGHPRPKPTTYEDEIIQTGMIN